MIVITGASSGIGLATAKILMGRGIQVLGAARSKEKLQAARLLALAGDVKDPNYAEQVFGIDGLERPTGLVCSAGIGGGGATEVLTSDKWQEVIDVNLTGSFLFVQAALKRMLPAGGGHIVLVSSTAGVYGYKRNAAYCASKHALVGLARSVMQEHGKRGIKIYVVCPGAVDTPMTDSMLAGLQKHQDLSLVEAKAKVAALSPQNRIIPAEEVGEFIAELVTGRFPSLAGQPIIMGDGE